MYDRKTEGETGEIRERERERERSLNLNIIGNHLQRITKKNEIRYVFIIRKTCFNIVAEATRHSRMRRDAEFQPPIPDEQRLYETIMHNYKPSVKPFVNATNPLVVAFKLRLNQIVALVS